MNIYEFNEEVIKKVILKHLSLDGFENLMENVSDY